VLHVVNRLGQRSETFQTGLIADLAMLGWQAWVVSHWPPVNRDEYAFPADDHFLAPERPRPWRSAFGRLSGRSARTRAAQWWRGPVEDIDPDVIHIHFGWAAAPAAFELLGRPTVVSFHGSDVRSWPRARTENRQVYDELFSSLDYGIASSHAVADEVRGLGFRGRVEVIHPGVHLDRWPFRMPQHDVEAYRLLFVGRQVECKGLDVLLAAMPRVLDACPTTSLVVVGDGEDAERNRETVGRLDLESRVEFRGPQPHEYVLKALRDVQALIVPSRTSAAGEAEGHPVAPKEAFAAGVPVIATRCGGLPDVFPPDQRSGLVPENDPEALAEAIVELLRHPETWRERATAARKWAEEQFDARRLAERVASFYADMRSSQAGSKPARQ
jgi:colanic acid/amylovoran biosynthesis glycosyltransferase